MRQIPDDGTLESTLALLRDPYRFISKQCRRYRTNLFQTRLMLRKTICMIGYEAAELFYNPQRFVREGVLPSPVKKLCSAKVVCKAWMMSPTSIVSKYFCRS